MNGMKISDRIAIFRACMEDPSPVAALCQLAAKIGDTRIVAQETIRMLVCGHRTFIGNGIKQVFPSLSSPTRSQVANHRSWIEFADTDALMQVVKFCLKNGVNPDDVYKNRTLLSTACRNNHQPLADFLLLQGASINGPSLPEGEHPIIPLHEAVHWTLSDNSHEQRSSFVFLTDRGADPNTPNAYGRNILFDALCSNRLDVANIMVELGADVMCLDYNDNNLMHHFIVNSGNPMERETLNWLVGHGIDPYYRNKDGDNAFDMYTSRFPNEDGKAMQQVLYEACAERQGFILENATLPTHGSPRHSGLRL